MGCFRVYNGAFHVHLIVTQISIIDVGVDVARGRRNGNDGHVDFWMIPGFILNSDELTTYLPDPSTHHDSHYWKSANSTRLPVDLD